MFAIFVYKLSCGKHTIIRVESGLDVPYPANKNFVKDNLWITETFKHENEWKTITKARTHTSFIYRSIIPTDGFQNAVHLSMYKRNLLRTTSRYDNVTLSPLLLPARVTNRSHSTYGSKLKFSLTEYFNFLFAYLVITYYSLQFLSDGDTK